MTRLLLASAACLSVAAFSTAASAFPPSGSAGQVGTQFGESQGSQGRDRVSDHRHRGRGDTVVLGGYGPSYSPYWGYTNNRSFAPDSFNDWWHDRPDRSLPRWVGQNGSCERQYWTGAGWRC